MNKINLGKLDFFLRAYKISSSLKKNTNTNWDLKITNLLKPLPPTYELPDGLGKITGIRFNYYKSEPNKLVFTITLRLKGKESKTYELTITPCFYLSFTVNITGEDDKCDENIARHLVTYFNIIFYYEQYNGIEN